MKEDMLTTCLLSLRLIYQNQNRKNGHTGKRLTMDTYISYRNELHISYQ